MTADLISCRMFIRSAARGTFFVGPVTIENFPLFAVLDVICGVQPLLPLAVSGQAALLVPEC
jgi:hypothetical protein